MFPAPANRALRPLRRVPIGLPGVFPAPANLALHAPRRRVPIGLPGVFPATRPLGDREVPRPTREAVPLQRSQLHERAHAV